MVVEVTSVPYRRRTVFKRRFIRLGLVLFTIASAIAADALLRSYTHYSQIIDARLASGYLTSRPGLYAAPRVLQAGQKLSRDKVVTVLRRAGYIETNASNVWSGSFIVNDAKLEIRPGPSPLRKPDVVTVLFDGDHISELRGDGIALESFALEPEILSNDLSSKSGNRELLSFGEIPERDGGRDSRHRGSPVL